MLLRRSVAIALAAFLSVAGAAGAVWAQEKAEPVQAAETAGPQRIDMIVVGLSCPFCAYGLEKKLKKVDGVTNIDIDFKTGNVQLEVNDGSEVSDDQIRKLVKDAGFEVRGEIQRSPLAAESAEAEQRGRR